MALIPSNEQVAQMIRQAMLDRAPSMYASLAAANQLDAAVQSRVEMFDEATSSAYSQAITDTMPLKDSSDPDERWMTADRQIRAATESALAMVLEFPPEDDPGESFPLDLAA
ncbi:MAG: hypothetical protein IT518_25210 [Burkholderiales bacterium]|nr:hypothetical protein [Burkholderiales bacterium]